MRVWEKSAEAVVAKKPWKQGRAKGRKTERQTILNVSKKRRAVFRNGRTLQLRQPFAPVAA